MLVSDLSNYCCSSLCGRSLLLDVFFFFFFQAEDGIRDLVRSRGLGDVYKRQVKLKDLRKGRCCIRHRDRIAIANRRTAPRGNL